MLNFFNCFMTTEVKYVLSTGLDIYNCIICILMLVSIFFSTRRDTAHKLFLKIVGAIFLFNIADMANWISEGTDQLWKVPYLNIMMFLYYMVIPLIVIFLIKYIQEYIKPEKVSNTLFGIVYLASIIFWIGLIISPFTGFYYIISPENYYSRGTHPFVPLIFYAIFYLSSMYVTIRNNKSFHKKTFIAFMSYSCLPCVTVIIQFIFPGLSLVNTAMTISILLIFVNSHSDLELSYKIKDDEVRKKEKKLITLQEHTIISLSNLVENRDIETGEHARRTSILVGLLANKTKQDGFYTDILTDRYIKLMIKAAPMHDIGKIVVSDIVLKKKGRLDRDEYEQMKLHAKEGGRIVSNIIGIDDDQEYVKIATEIAKSHHERWDGLGYPEKLTGKQIPLCARIMAVADVFDALVFERCYKKAITPDEAFNIINGEAGTHFDPVLVQEFLKIKEEILRIMQLCN